MYEFAEGARLHARPGGVVGQYTHPPWHLSSTTDGSLVMDNLTVAFREGLCFNASGLNDAGFDTCMEEWGVDDPAADAANVTLDGPMWCLAASARSAHAGSSVTVVPGANTCNGPLFDAPAAVALSDSIGATFLVQFRSALSATVESAQGLLTAMRLHTAWIDQRDSRTQGHLPVYSPTGRAINRDPASADPEIELLMAQLLTASPAYYWYVRAS